MAYDPQGFVAIRDSLIADAKNRIAGLDTTEDTDLYALLSVMAGAAWMLQYGLKYLEDQIFPSSADSENLERHAATYGLSRKAAEAADDGRIYFGGTAGTVLPAGTRVLTDDGVGYTVDADTTIGVLGFTAFVACTCEVAGTTGNRSSTTVLTVEDPPTGINPTATISVKFTTGTEAETDAQLLRRLLLRIQSGGAGGTAADYTQWALSINGVAYAWCLPLRRGLGTVTVVPFGADEDDRRVDPGDSIRGEVADYIDTVRPVTAEVDVAEATEVDVDVDVEITELDDGYELSDVSTAVETAIADVIYALGPGDPLYLKQLIRAIAKVDGVLDFEIATPTANVEPTLDATTVEILVPGTVTIT